MQTTSFSCSLKPDFAQTLARFEAWWAGEVIDRPPVTLRVAPTRPYDGPQSQHATLRERWLDVDFQVAAADAHLRRHEYPGDALPVYVPNVGPDLVATLLGCELDFGEDTSWSHPIIDTVEGWDALEGREPDFGNLYWRAIERMTDAALQRSGGAYLVGLPDLHGNYDILAALRDPQALCMDMIDDPQRVAGAGMRVAEVFNAVFERSYQPLRRHGQPAVTWCHQLHQGPAYLPSCDFWCMVSDDAARQMILPAIRREMQPLERSLFHLDGPQALRHLDLLLELPELDAVQWVYGAGNGPAAKWVDVYRRIVAAGKSAHVLAADADDALTVLCELGPAGLWLEIGGSCASGAEADDILQRVSRACRGAA